MRKTFSNTWESSVTHVASSRLRLGGDPGLQSRIYLSCLLTWAFVSFLLCLTLFTTHLHDLLQMNQNAKTTSSLTTHAWFTHQDLFCAMEQGSCGKIICDHAVIVLQFSYMLVPNKGCIDSYNSACPLEHQIMKPLKHFACILFCLFRLGMVYKPKLSFRFHLPLSFSGLPHQYQVIFLFFFLLFLLYCSSTDISMSCNLFSL